MAKYLKWLNDSGLVLGEGDIEGVAEKEILEMELKFNLQLPRAYKDFMHQCGRKAGRFATDINMFYPDVLELRECYQGAKDEFVIPFEMPENAFIFYMYQGGFFNFFICDGNEDPAIYSVNDGQAEPSFVYSSFSTFIEQAILSYQKLWSDYKKSD